MSDDVFAPVCPGPGPAGHSLAMQVQAAPLPYCLRTCGETVMHTSAGVGQGLRARALDPAFVGRARQRGTH